MTVWNDAFEQDTTAWTSGTLTTNVSLDDYQQFWKAWMQEPLFLNNRDRDRYHLARARFAFSTAAHAPTAVLWRPRVTTIRRLMRSRGTSGWIHRGGRRPLRCRTNASVSRV